MSASSSTEPDLRRRRLIAAMLLLAPLAACGKKGGLRLPTPEELAAEEEGDE